MKEKMMQAVLNATHGRGGTSLVRLEQAIKRSDTGIKAVIDVPAGYKQTPVGLVALDDFGNLKIGSNAPARLG